MENNETRPTREPSHTPGFIRAVLIIFIGITLLIIFAKVVVGVKIGVFGL
jgi:hypothetical protein